MRSLTMGQLLLLLASTRLAPVICFTPTLAVGVVGQCWQSALVSWGLALPLLALPVALACRFPGETLVQVLPRLLGTLPGKGLGCAYLFFFFHVATLDMRVFAETILAGLVPQFPLAVLIVSMAMVILLAVRGGLTVLGRLAQMLTPMVILVTGVALLLVVKDVQGDRLVPHLEYGWGPVLVGAAGSSALFGELAVVTMLVPGLRRPAEAWRAVYGAFIISAVLLLAVTVTAVGLFGVQAHRLTLPFLTIARQIQIGIWIENVESVVLLGFMAMWLVKSSLFLYVTAQGLGDWLGVHDHRPLLGPLAILLAIAALALARSVPELASFFQSFILAPYYGVMGYGVPGLLLVVAWLRGIRGAAEPKTTRGRRFRVSG